MRKIFTFWLLLFAAFGARAVDKHILTITITNLPVTGNNLSFSSPATKVITWSNVTAGTWVATNTTVNGCATNLFLQIAANAPWTPRPALSWANTNSFNVEGDCGSVIAVTNSGAWVTLSINTNDCAKQRTVNVPIAAEKWSTSRVEIASLLVTGLNDYPTNLFGSNAPVMGHFLGLNTNGQRALGRKRFDQLDTSTNITTIYGGTNSGVRIENATSIGGVLGSITNGYGTNQIFDRPKTTNAINYGNAFSSPGNNAAGAVTTSEQFGAGALATNTLSIAIGPSALAGGHSSMAIGYASFASTNNTMAIGEGTTATAYAAQAFGLEANAAGVLSLAIGHLSAATFNNSVAIGPGANTTAAGQMMLGSTDVTQVRAFGRFEAGSLTNNTFTGTNRNDGAWGDTPLTITTLANGNNVLNPGNAKVIRISGGPTAAFSINSIQGGWNGREVEVWNDNGNALTVAHENGFDTTNANRIITSGADVVFGTNVYLRFRYFTDRNRWKLSASRE